MSNLKEIKAEILKIKEKANRNFKNGQFSNSELDYKQCLEKFFNGVNSGVIENEKEMISFIQEIEVSLRIY